MVFTGLAIATPVSADHCLPQATTYTGALVGTGSDQIQVWVRVANEDVMAPQTLTSSPDVLTTATWDLKKTIYSRHVDPNDCVDVWRHEDLKGRYKVTMSGGGVYTCEFRFLALYPPNSGGNPDPEPVAQSYTSNGYGSYLAFSAPSIQCTFDTDFYDSSPVSASTGWAGFDVLCIECNFPGRSPSPNGYGLFFSGGFQTTGANLGIEI